jgi:hypothetical protein
MKQTAVEQLELKLLGIISFDSEELRERYKDIIEQAKEMEREQRIAFGKKCFYKGFEKAENDDANCFTAWREEVNELLTFKSE